MAIKVNLSLDTVRVCCAVGVGNIEILKWKRTGAQSWDNKGVCVTGYCYLLLLRNLLVTSHLSAGPLPLIVRNFSSQYCTNHITALWEKSHKNTIRQQSFLSSGDIMRLMKRWDFVNCIAAFVLDSLLMVEHTPQCPRYHLHGLLCLSWVCKLSSPDEFHSLGRLSDLWRHTFRMIKQTDPVSHFLSWRQFILEASNFPGSVQPSAKRRRKDDALQSLNSRYFEAIRIIDDLHIIKDYENFMSNNGLNHNSWHHLYFHQLCCLLVYS